MRDLDQENYVEMIEEANTLRIHLHEWAEQLNEDTSDEGAGAWDAYRHAEIVCNSLNQAKEQNRIDQDREVDMVLQRVASGTTTKRDVSTLRIAIARGKPPQGYTSVT